ERLVHDAGNLRARRTSDDSHARRPRFGAERAQTSRGYSRSGGPSWWAVDGPDRRIYHAQIHVIRQWRPGMTLDYTKSMRTRLLPALAVPALSLVACAAQEGDAAESQDSNVPGGSGTVEPPVLFLFDATAASASATSTASPKCAGAMLGDKVGVTAKACAKE